MGLTDASDSRLTELTRWVAEDLGFAGSRIEPASADASFRRYFRLSRDGETFIVMDAPPDKEDVMPFVEVARALAGMQLNVPVVLARDTQRGFLLLSDLGTRQYLVELLADRDVERLYGDALDAIVVMQKSGELVARGLPDYDRMLLLRELELLDEWFLRGHLGLELRAAERAMLDRTFAALVRGALSQPAAFVHRDYHSRNLLVTVANNPGILDFQDAVRGPITYDAVSLLKDCYVAWPAARVHRWALAFRMRLIAAGCAAGTDDAQFLSWFELMGVQRHLKVLGIFARLFYRDGKSGYLKDLPRVLDYVRAAAATTAETADFADFLAERIDPVFPAAQARVLAQIHDGG